MSDLITQSELKSILHYDKHTGFFTWLCNRSRGAKIGMRAGSIWKDRKGKQYRQIKISGKQYYEHRLAWLFVHGNFPNDEIDHINGDGTDNSFENLRSVSKRENSKNQKKHKTNTSGATGVAWLKKNKKWIARIRINGKYIYLGCFVDKDDAIKARKLAENKFGFHKNHGKTVCGGSL